MKDRINRPEEPDDKTKALDELKRFSDEQMEKYGAHHWILNESGEVIPASLLEWTFWFERNPQRVIQQDYFEDHKVSTIFEGLDICYGLHDPARPIVFKTMVFGPPEESEWFDGTTRMMRPSLWQERDCTLQEALKRHQEGIEWLKDYLNERQKIPDR
jgi:hypothetical protein